MYVVLSLSGLDLATLAVTQTLQAASRQVNNLQRRAQRFRLSPARAESRPWTSGFSPPAAGVVIVLQAAQSESRRV